MRRKEERSKQGQTNNKAKQHSTPMYMYTCTCTCTCTCMSFCTDVYNVRNGVTLANLAWSAEMSFLPCCLTSVTLALYSDIFFKAASRS